MGCDGRRATAGVEEESDGDIAIYGRKGRFTRPLTMFCGWENMRYGQNKDEQGGTEESQESNTAMGAKPRERKLATTTQNRMRVGGSLIINRRWDEDGDGRWRGRERGMMSKHRTRRKRDLRGERVIIKNLLRWRQPDSGPIDVTLSV